MMNLLMEWLELELCMQQKFENLNTTNVEDVLTISAIGMMRQNTQFGSANQMPRLINIPFCSVTVYLKIELPSPHLFLETPA